MAWGPASRHAAATSGHRGTATLITPDVELAFYVDADGDVVLLERVLSPATYTEALERQAENERRRTQPRARIRIKR